MRPLALAWVGVVLLAYPSLGDLPLPPNLVALSSQVGAQLLLDSEYRSDYMLLSQHFVTQVNTAFCGPASSVTVLNALGTPRPPQDPTAGFTSPDYAYYTQVNVFDANTEKVVPQTQVRAQGMSLEELSLFLGAHQGVSATHLHSDPERVTLNVFRDTILQALAMPQMFAIVNFDRSVLMERGGGHHSPIAAYHKPTDSVLVLDVSRYKYVAWWVPMVDLYQSTSKTLDSGSNKTRGLVVVWASNVYGAQYQLAKTANALAGGLDNGSPLVVASRTTGWYDDPSHSGHRGGLSPGAATGLAIAMLVAGAMSGLALSMWLNAKRREKSLRSLSGVMSDSFNHHGEVSMGSKWPWPGSVYAGYREGMGKGVPRDEEGEARLLSSNDGTNKV